MSLAGVLVAPKVADSGDVVTQNRCLAIADTVAVTSVRLYLILFSCKWTSIRTEIKCN
jgi:hypothetical protein